MSKIFFALGLLLVASIVNSEVVFTGNAKLDFVDTPLLTEREILLRHSFQDTQPMNCGPYMNAQVPRRRSGLDLDAIHVVYDDSADILYFGAQCAGICGDSDGDGNPSGITGPTAELKTDTPNMCNNEEMSVMIWDQVPEDYTVRVDDRQFFFPTMVIGVDYSGCTTQNTPQGVVSNWNAYEWRDYQDCLWPIPRDEPDNNCVSTQRFYVNDPGNGVYTGRKMHEQYNIPPIVTPFFRPNSTHPHIEWYLRDWKNYPQNDFSTNYTGEGKPMRMGLTTVSASLSDSCGEDRILSEVWSVKWDCNGSPYTTEHPLIEMDLCGECGGLNDCMDCNGTLWGNWTVDACGICGGDNSSCKDCAGVINGTASYDDYQVCNGGNYHDCENNPYGNKTYDSCHVCGGDDTTCQCLEYLGYDIEAVDYALLRWTITANLIKINDILALLESIKETLPGYDYQHGAAHLADYIDTLHGFCDDCLDNFDLAQIWFAEYLTGSCDELRCQPHPNSGALHWDM